MNVLVTGAAGKLGKYLIDTLKAHHNVMAFDIKSPEDEEIAFIKGDMLNITDCEKALHGIDAIVHLAAIYDFKNCPPEKMVEINAMGTFNFLQAAENRGVKKFIFTSTDSTLGFWWKTKDFLPEYLPIDEAHPTKPQDSYGLSKLVGEQMCHSFSYKGSVDTVILRPPWIWFPEQAESYKGVVESPDKFPQCLWCYVHVADLARAYRLALESENARNETFWITAKDNCSREKTADLLANYLPSLDAQWQAKFVSNESIISCAKAQALLGYEAQFSWRDLTVE